MDIHLSAYHSGLLCRISVVLVPRCNSHCINTGGGSQSWLEASQPRYRFGRQKSCHLLHVKTYWFIWCCSYCLAEAVTEPKTLGHQAPCSCMSKQLREASEEPEWLNRIPITPQATSVPAQWTERIAPFPPTPCHTACLLAPLYLLHLVRGLPWSSRRDELCMYCFNWRWWGAQRELFLSTGNNTYKITSQQPVKLLAGIQTALETSG